MTLSDLADIASVIAGLAVVLTLPILIISIRQNTKAQRAIVVDNLATAIANINAPLTSDPAIGAAIQATSENWHTATRDQRIMAHYFFYSMFKLNENAWYQMRAGILERDVWEGWAANMVKFYHLPGIQDVWWPARAKSYNEDFCDYLAASTPPDVGELSDIFDCESDPESEKCGDGDG